MATVGIVLQGNFKSDFARFRGELGRLSQRVNKLPIQAAFVAARAIMELYKEFLRSGVGKDLSNLTKATTSDHPPLATLADRVILQRRTDGGARITFQKGWSTRASLLDTGFFRKITDQQRAAVFARAYAMTGESNLEGIFGTSSKGDSGGIWEVPARPHIWFLRDPAHLKILKAVGELMAFEVPLPPAVVAAVTFRSSKRSYGAFAAPGPPSRQATAVSTTKSRRRRKTTKRSLTRRGGGRARLVRRDGVS